MSEPVREEPKGREQRSRHSSPADLGDSHFPGWGIHSGAVGLRGSRDGEAIHLSRRGIALVLLRALVVVAVVVLVLVLAVLIHLP